MLNLRAASWELVGTYDGSQLPADRVAMDNDKVIYPGGKTRRTDRAPPAAKATVDAAATSDDDDGNNAALTIVVVLMAIVLCIVAVFVCILVRKEKKGTPMFINNI